MAFLDQIRRELAKSRLTITHDERLGNDSGHQIRLREGPILNLFDNGNCSLQGKNHNRLSHELLELIGHGDRGESTHSSRSVFVVYGHDTDARTQLEALLRRWQLEPVILDQLPSEGQTVIEKLEKYKGDACYAVVLATPDDEGHVRDKPEERAFRARQNVVLELGMMLAHLGRPRVAVLMKAAQQMERPSDIQGVLYIPFSETVDEAKVTLAKEMQKQGVHIDLARL